MNAYPTVRHMSRDTVAYPDSKIKADMKAEIERHEAQIERHEAQIRKYQVALEMRKRPAAEPWEAKRVLANPSEAMQRVFQDRDNLAMLSHCLRREDENKSEVYDILTAPFMRENFLPLMSIPQYTLMTTLEGHTDEVWCLEYHDGKIYSASEDGIIKIWNSSDGSLINTLQEHAGIISSLTIYDGKLHSACRTDETIKVWSCSTDALLTTLEGFVGRGNAICFDDGKVYTGGQADDGQYVVDVWNCSDDYSHIATLRHDDDGENENEGHNGHVTRLIVRDGKLYSAGGVRINVWDCSTKQLSLIHI